MSPADLHIMLCRHHSTVQWFITQVHHREQQALGRFFRSSFIVKLIIPQRLTSRHYWTYLKQKEDPLMFIDSSSNILSSVLLPFNWWSGVKWWYKRCIRRTFDQNSRLIRMTFGCLRTKKKKKISSANETLSSIQLNNDNNYPHCWIIQSFTADIFCVGVLHRFAVPVVSRIESEPLLYIDWDCLP